MHEMKMNQKIGAESEGLNHQFSQVKRDLNLQETLQPISISKKSTKKNKIKIVISCAYPLNGVRVKKKEKNKIKKSMKEPKKRINTKG
jgi:hypothetical protein